LFEKPKPVKKKIIHLVGPSCPGVARRAKSEAEREARSALFKKLEEKLPEGVTVYNVQVKKYINPAAMSMLKFKQFQQVH
jgi:O-acetyl-ADP-ribose deacetylase (regulator of RNase III)